MRAAMRGAVVDQLLFTLFVLALATLFFIGGMLANIAGLFPSGPLRDAWRAALALQEKQASTGDYLTTDLWREERNPGRGVTVHDDRHAVRGLTLYSSGHAPVALLIDMDGRQVHEWRKPYSEIWDGSAVVKNPVPDSQTYFRKAHAFANGDLLAVYDGVGDTPYGYGMVKLDAASNVLWKNLDHHFHHSFDVGGDGRIYALSHRFRSDPLANEAGYLVDHLARPILDDYLIVLSPDGKLQKKISLIDAVNNSPWRRLLWRVSSFSLEDPLHTNDVNVLDRAAAEALARKVPVAREGQVLLSFRELATGTLALYDLEQGRIVWAQHGQWMAQHDPDVTPDGNLLTFDNLGHFGPGGQSRLIEIDPASGGVVWAYSGDEDNPLDSDIRSEQERLANGNVLITDANPGRIFEVTRGGDIVWEYINPVRERPRNAQRKAPLVPVVSWAQRIDPAALDEGFRASLQPARQLSQARHHRSNSP